MTKSTRTVRKLRDIDFSSWWRPRLRRQDIAATGRSGVLAIRREQVCSRPVAMQSTSRCIALVGLLEPAFYLQVDISERGQCDTMRNSILLRQPTRVAQACREGLL